MSSLLAALQGIDLDSGVGTFPKNQTEAVKAALLYRAGKWEQAHKIAQGIPSSEGSFWHAILHRTEGDWENAAYWFRQVGDHPIYSLIYADAVQILAVHTHSDWDAGNQWDPFEFVRWCKAASLLPGSAEENIVNRIQVSEWRHLFSWCAR